MGGRNQETYAQGNVGNDDGPFPGYLQYLLICGLGIDLRRVNVGNYRTGGHHHGGMVAATIMVMTAKIMPASSGWSGGQCSRQRHWPITQAVGIGFGHHADDGRQDADRTGNDVASTQPQVASWSLLAANMGCRAA